MDNIPSEDAISNFSPSLVVVICVLATIFLITFLLLIYAKFFYKSLHGIDGVNVHHTSTSGQLIRSNFSGIDKMVIESLPFFRFSSLKGTREGLECAVCLSKFEDVEVLRLLPKCKHAFHINCVDQWLEYHSTCPLCRQKISTDDVIFFTNSSSLRLLRTHSEITEDSNFELFIEREEENTRGSSRFSCGGSFSRRYDKLKREEEAMPIQQESSNRGNISINENDEEILHKLNHKIIVSDVVLKNRWSNVSSSDLMFLNSNMLNEISSNRFTSLRSNSEKNVTSNAIEDVEMLKIKEEMGRKIAFESKFSKITQSDKIPIVSSSSSRSSESSRILNHSEKRSISEITIHPRFKEVIGKSSSAGEFCIDESNEKEERVRSVWLPIAQRTTQWFVNRERRDSQSHNTRDSLNV